MTGMSRRTAIGAAAAFAWSGTARAEAWPTRPIRLVVPFSAGGPTDVIARALGERLQAKWGQPVVIDNRAGAGGSIGAEAVSRAPADGYTLLMTTAGVLTVNPSLQAVRFDAVRDFAPVGLAATLASLLVVPPSLGVTTAKQFIALAKSKPDTMNFGSSGVGSTSHLSMTLFDRAAGIRLQHVPYKGASPAVTDLLGSNIQAMLIGVSTVLPYVKAGSLVALGVSSAAPSPLAPSIPTIASAAELPGFEASNWLGLFAPAGTPRGIVEQLNAEINRTMALPEVRASLATDGFEPVGANSSQQFGSFFQGEIRKWKGLIREAGITAN